MSLEDYKSARQLGQKEYRACVSRGEYPYLQVLDEVLTHTDVQGEEPLGLVNIPIEKLVGTRSAGRRDAFARNFMPLLDADSEFAVKWTALSEAHLEEGIREPITAFEFMNRFYVAEGNKRVSVLKFFGAASVPGVVRRVVPKRRDTLESRIYYDFLDFYRLSRVNCLWVSQPGRFGQLLRAVHGDDELWTEEERGEFTAAYVLFRRAFLDMGGGKLPGTTGDALLAYLNLYGYPSLRESTDGELRENLEKSWPELAAQSAPKPVELTLAPEPVQKSFLGKLLPGKTMPLHVAFLHAKSGKTSGWTQAHEEGRLSLEKRLGRRVITVAQENVTPESAAEHIFRAAAAGNEVIFTTSPRLMAATLKASVEYPEVKFLNCSLYMPHPSIRTYYGRMYEAKFLTGVIAGALTERHRIGYVADYPIYGAAAAINAFALGAQMVDPLARVYLEWSTRRDGDVRETFRDVGVDMVSYQDLLSPQAPEREYGLYQLRDGAQTRVAVSRWNWGRFYELILRIILEGGWKGPAEAKDGPKAINCWWGMSAGVVECEWSADLAGGTRRLVELLRDNIVSGAFHPFAGPLRSQTGPALEQGELTAEEIVRMDWLAENVVGSFPAPDELTDEARALAAVQGLAGEGIL